MLNPQLTFESYRISQAEEFAVSYLKTCVLSTIGEHVHVWGPKACGKTHLLQALANHRQERDAGPLLLRTAEYLVSVLLENPGGERIVQMADRSRSGRSILWIIDSWEHLQHAHDELVCDFLNDRLSRGDSVFTASLSRPPPSLQVQAWNFFIGAPAGETTSNKTNSPSILHADR